MTLALGIAADLGVVVATILKSGAAGMVAAGMSLVVLSGLWHVYPALLRRRRSLRA